MEPIAVTVRGERRWVLIHRCTRCGRLRMNRAAADDNVLLLVQLAALPLAHAAGALPAPGRRTRARLHRARFQRTRFARPPARGRATGLRAIRRRRCIIAS